MEKPVWEVEKDNLKVEVYEDTDAESPREMYEPLGTIIGHHGRYNIFDERSKNNDDYSSWEEWRAGELPKDAICLPVYAYIHGGMTISTTPFGDPWDSGQLGYIYVTRQAARENFMVKRLTKKKVEETENVLRGEIQEMDDYLNKPHYFYHLIEDDEIVDSCHGFIQGEKMVEYMASNWPQAFMALKDELAKEVG